MVHRAILKEGRKKIRQGIGWSGDKIRKWKIVGGEEEEAEVDFNILFIILVFYIVVKFFYYIGT